MIDRFGFAALSENLLNEFYIYPQFASKCRRTTKIKCFDFVHNEVWQKPLEGAELFKTFVRSLFDLGGN